MTNYILKVHIMKYCKIFTLLILAFLIFQLNSCESDDPLDPDYEKVVIQAYIFAGETVDDIKITNKLTKIIAKRPITVASILKLSKGCLFERV